MTRAFWLGIAVFAVSLGLRLIGITWGLPNELHNQSYHPDEPIVWAVSQQIDPAHLQFTPGFYNYGTAYLTMIRLASGYCPMPESVNPAEIARYERCCELAGRVVSALAGAGTALAVFLILKRRTNLLGATLGGLAIGFAPAFVMHSRFQTVDVTATFFAAVSLLFALKILPDQEGVPPEHYVRLAGLAGVFAGLSAGTKYTGALVLLALVAAILLASRPDWARLLVVAIAAALGAFLITTPGVLLDRERFMASFNYETAHTATGHGLVFVDTPSGYIQHLLNMGVGFGMLPIMIGIAGLAHAAYRRNVWAIALLAFAIPYYLLIGHAEVKFVRYTFPLLVPLAIGLGWAMGQANRRGGWGHVAVGVGIIAAFWQVRGATLYTVWMFGEDPRDQFGRFLRDESSKHPDMTVGVIDDPWFYTPALYPDITMTRAQWSRDGELAMANARNPRVVRFEPAAKPEYVVYSSLERYDLARLANAKDLSGPDQARVDQYRRPSRDSRRTTISSSSR